MLDIFIQTDAIEKAVEAYSHSYEVQLDDGSNVKCVYCDKTQVTVSVSNELPKAVTTKVLRDGSKAATK